jgi:hypothetical protein
MSRPKWTEAEAAGAAKEADRMSATAAAYAKARSELATLFGWNAGALSPDQMLRLDCAVALRLALDDLQGRLIRGEPIDMNRMLTASEALSKLLPPAVLASPPPDYRDGDANDPRRLLFEMYMEMRRRGGLADEDTSLDALRAEIEALQAEVAALKAAGSVTHSDIPTVVERVLVPAGNVVPLPRPSPPAAPAAPQYDYNTERGWRDHILPDGNISPRPMSSGKYWGPV